MMYPPHHNMRVRVHVHARPCERATIYVKLCDSKKILIYGKIKSPKQYKFHRQMPIPNSKFVDLPDDPTSKCVVSHNLILRKI